MRSNGPKITASSSRRFANIAGRPFDPDQPGDPALDFPDGKVARNRTKSSVDDWSAQCLCSQSKLGKFLAYLVLVRFKAIHLPDITLPFSSCGGVHLRTVPHQHMSGNLNFFS